MICPNCNSKSIIKKRKIYVTEEKIITNLCHCNNCDYLYLENPNWLEIAYRRKFYSDTGHVCRNYDLVKKSIILFRIWRLCSWKKLPKACDIGAGMGMYARLMRDNGYNFCGSDQYSEMLLIQPFIKKNVNYPIKTSFEVVEHLTSLPNFLKEQIKNVDLFLFSTELRKVGHVPDDDWWYYSFQIGQHIGFHSKKSLKKAFEISGYESKKLISYGSSLHAFANTREWNFSLKLSHLIWKLFGVIDKCNKIIKKIIFNEKSLTLIDNLHIMNSLTNNHKNKY